MGQRVRPWFERSGRAARFAQDPSGPQPVRAIIDHATITSTQVIRSTVTVTGTVGQLFQFVATAYDAAGNVVPGVVATWSVADAGVASVSATGLVTMLRSGTTTVTATVDGRAYPTVASVTAAAGVAQDGSLADLRNVATDAGLAAVRSGTVATVDGSGNVSSWPDARGATGFAPPLTQATANARPALNATTGTLTFDGVNDVLTGPAVNALALTTRPVAIGIVATIPNGGYYAGLISGDGTRILALGTPAGVVRAHTPTADASTAYAAPDATTRAILVQYGTAPTIAGDATSSTAWLGVEVEPKLRTLANPESSIEASGDLGETVGGLSLFGQFGATAVKEWVVFATEVTAPIRAAWERYANARGAVPIAANKRLLWGFDSIAAGFNTQGDGATHPEDSIGGQLLASGLISGYDYVNMGVAGRWLQNITLRPGYIAGQIRPGDVVMDISGTNDVQGGRTPAQEAADKATVYRAVKAAGGRVICLGLTPRLGFDVTPYNAQFATFGSDLVDLFRNPQNIVGANDPSNTAQYQDNLHPRRAVNTLILNDMLANLPAGWIW